MPMHIEPTEIDEITMKAVTDVLGIFEAHGRPIRDEDSRTTFAREVTDRVRHGLLMASSKNVLDMCQANEARRQRVRALMTYHNLSYGDAKEREARESSIPVGCKDHETEGKCINCGLPADG